MLAVRMRIVPPPVSHRARSVRFWGLLLGAMSTTLATTSALAGPPFITDDPEPVDFRAWEINYGLTYLHAAGASAGSLPSLDINYGIYPGVQLHLQPQAAYARSGAARAYGIGDTEIGVKYRLTEKTEDKRAWMLAIYPMLELPTGSAKRGLGAGARSLYLPLWAQTTRGNWTVFGGGGYRRDARIDAKNSWAGGMTALYQVSERLQFGGELFGATRNTEAGRASMGTNFGGVYMLGGGLSLLFSAGHGLRDAQVSNQGAIYLGLRSAY
jgi:hypothetical protein